MGNLREIAQHISKQPLCGAILYCHTLMWKNIKSLNRRQDFIGLNGHSDIKHGFYQITVYVLSHFQTVSDFPMCVYGTECWEPEGRTEGGAAVRFSEIFLNKLLSPLQFSLFRHVPVTMESTGLKLLALFIPTADRTNGKKYLEGRRRFPVCYLLCVAYISHHKHKNHINVFARLLSFLWW